MDYTETIYSQNKNSNSKVDILYNFRLEIRGVVQTFNFQNSSKIEDEINEIRALMDDESEDL